MSSSATFYKILKFEWASTFDLPLGEPNVNMILQIEAENDVVGLGP